MVQLQPRASRNQLVGLQGEALKLKLTAPPVDGAANKASCAYLAKLFGLSRGSVELIAGGKSRQKTFLLKGLNARTAMTVLESHLETAS